MTSPSHNACPTGPALSANDDTWNPRYPGVTWPSTTCYPTSTPGIVGQHCQWLHHDPQNNPNIGIPPIPASPCSSATMTPPSSYHPNPIPWPVGSSNGYILPDTSTHNANATSHPSISIGTPIGRINSFNLNYSPEGSTSDSPPDSSKSEHTCAHGILVGAHWQSRQTSGIDVNHCGRYKCRWEGCTYTSTFSRITCLWRHIKSTHVAPEEFKCPDRDCNETFGRKDKLQSHMRVYHVTHANANASASASGLGHGYSTTPKSCSCQST